MASEAVSEEATGFSAGRQALATLDDILRAKPTADPQLFSNCTQGLSTLRDHLIAEQRTTPPTPADRTRLAHVNAIISVVLAGHFPLGPIPWDELGKARAWLQAVLDRPD